MAKRATPTMNWRIMIYLIQLFIILIEISLDIFFMDFVSVVFFMGITRTFGDGC